MNFKVKTLAAVVLFASSVTRASTIEQLILDDTIGNSATIDVDNLGFTSCSGTGTGCGGLTVPASITPHSSLLVFGTLGQFRINAMVGIGGADAIYPTLQNLVQSVSASTGAGTFNTFFTDTDYCLGGGGCFDTRFGLSLTNNPDSAIGGSSTAFGVFVSDSNGVPAGTLVAFEALAGVSALANTYPTPISASSGSLSSATSTVFTNRGSVATTMQVSAAHTPEPSTFALMGIAAIFGAFKVRHMRG